MDYIKKLISILVLSAMLVSSAPLQALASEEPVSGEPAEEAASVDETEGITAETAAEQPDGYEQPEEFADSPEADETPTEEPEVEPEEETEAEADGARPWVEPGNTDAEITAGGRYLLAGGVLYYSDGGIWTDRDGATSFLSTDEGRFLNLSDGWLYYTVGAGEVRRIPASGGAAETVWTFGGEIEQLYVMGGELRFLSGGCAYSYDRDTAALVRLEAPEHVLGLIPTPHGNLFLTGEPRSFTLWAEKAELLSGVEQCRRDGEWIVFVKNGETLQASLSGAFGGTFSAEPYSLHGEMLSGSGLSEEQQLENEAAFLQSETYALMQDGLSLQLDGAYTAANSNIASTAYTSSSMTTDQKNIVLRGRQMAEVRWTPIVKRYSWGGDDSSYVSNNQGWGSKVTATDGSTTYGYFAAGKTYEGVPYSQAVYTGYVGWSISIDDFVEATNNSSSKFYSGYSGYSRTAPYYGSDCSGFVSWAWDLSSRCTCTSLLRYSDYIGKSLSSLRIGDCLNNPNSHVVLITDIGYNADGNVNAVEITEETPCKMRVTCYGELFPGKTYQYTGSLSYIERNYFNGGYAIYRRSSSRSVSFQESSAVTLAESGYAAAPTVSVSVNAAGSAKLVTLSHSSDSAAIYYTTDGSRPSSSSTRYTGPISVSESTTIRAVAVLGAPYTGSYELTYTVSVSKAETPFIVLVDGDLQDGCVSSGTTVRAVNEAGDTVYYTTDGTTPSKLSAVMPAAGIRVTKDMTLRAIAVSSSDLNSDPAVISLKLGSFRHITASSSLGGYITPSGRTGVLQGADCAFSIVPMEHFKIDDVLVDGKSVGKVTSYRFRDVTADHTIRVSFAVDLPFRDVTSGWYVENVAFVYSHDLFAGTSGTSFSPNAYMTRGMFITVLGRFAGNGEWTDLESWSGCLGVTNASTINIRNQTNTSDTSVILGRTGSAGQRVHVLSIVPSGLDGATWYRITTGSATGYVRSTANTSGGKKLLYVYGGSFTDLPAGAYYTGYAQWAYMYGLARGISDTQFGANRYIRRQDICLLLYEYLTSYLGRDLSSVAGTFTDDASISAYARTAVYAMKNIGVVSGYKDGSFRPGGYATRAEVATMFESLYEYLYG